MLHRSTDIRHRDNQENRVQQFPKTPKNTSFSKSSFITPAPKSRVALGAKSTNVHNRQFTSVKPGKRHSPVTILETPVIVRPTEPLSRGDALRAAFQRALDNGDDLPDVEYCPPPVVEMPYREDDIVFTEEELRLYAEEDARQRPETPNTFEPTSFDFLDDPTSYIKSKPKVARFAQPTISAQAKMKPRVQPALRAKRTVANRAKQQQREEEDFLRGVKSPSPIYFDVNLDTSDEDDS